MSTFLRSFTLILALSLSSYIASGQATAYSFDQSYSSVTFKIQSMGLNDVTGRFDEFGGEVRARKADLTDGYFSFFINASSVNTQNTLRDNQLKGNYFLSASRHPSINFSSTSFNKVGGNKFKLTGMMKIRGVTKEMTFDVEYLGTVTDENNNQRYGYEVTGVIDRFDFGMEYNEKVDGKPIVGRHVHFAASVQLVKQRGNSAHADE